MSAIIFHNPGVLDMRAVRTFGLSVKKTASPIGFFGTGLKYAIAVLLREGCEVEICAGLRRYEFVTMQDMFRGETYDQIIMDGDDADHLQLPFTLQLGKTWKLWQAYRELYCNALDEGGNVCDKHDGADPRDDYTFVIVRGQKFADVHARRQAFINSEAPILTSEKVAIVRTPGVYLKSIRVADEIYYPPLFGYRFESGLDLTEDRTMKYPHQAETMVMNALKCSDDYDLINAVLTAKDGTFEEQISWENGNANVGETFRRALLDLARNQPDKISSSAKSLARKIDAQASAAAEHTLIPTQQQSFERAVAFLARRGINVHDFPINFVETLGANIWGKAVAGEIFISAECFQFGIKSLVATLYEEHLHLSKGYGDLTRDMQNHLFHTVVSLWEEIEGEAI